MWPQVLVLSFLRRLVAESRMKPFPIVEVFDVSDNQTVSFRPTYELKSVQPLVLQRTEERFGIGASHYSNRRPVRPIDCRIPIALSLVAKPNEV
jgi:hypothetical protein